MRIIPLSIKSVYDYYLYSIYQWYRRIVNNFFFHCGTLLLFIISHVYRQEFEVEEKQRGKQICVRF